MTTLHLKLHRLIYHTAATLALLLFLALSTPFSTGALAQSAESTALQESPAEPVWKKNLGIQFTHILQSSSREVREDALATMIGLAQDKQYKPRSRSSYPSRRL